MLLYISIVLILLLASYSVYYSYQRRQKLTCIVGMMVAMTTGMMTVESILTGLKRNGETCFMNI